MCAYQLVESIHCETASEFIELISPTGKCFNRFAPVEKWIFRGHGDDSYRLIPSALRTENMKALQGLARSDALIIANAHVNICQWFAEVSVIRDFLLQADASGLQVPEDS